MKNNFYIIAIAVSLLSLELKSIDNKKFTPQYMVIDDEIYTVISNDGEGEEAEIYGQELLYSDFKKKIKPSFLSTLIFGDIVQKEAFNTNKRYNIDFIHKTLGSSATTYLQACKIINEQQQEIPQPNKHPTIKEAIAKRINKNKSISSNDLTALESELKFASKHNKQELSKEGEHSFIVPVAVYGRDYTKPICLAATAAISTLLAFIVINQIHTKKN